MQYKSFIVSLNAKWETASKSFTNRAHSEGFRIMKSFTPLRSADPMLLRINVIM